ncbi:HlyD family efflux transporter periplasmic adaptor subunit [Shewanella avicenniae]|uniref:HlyD family efflux transporter periplasmic adaptor subunit n=1 Tax=Shewanella avicenniae TaxID=2814294 RepID=A0ABX7QLC8_9GAMM|nr:HlyD family efflux transporter periplasmic adaptor subunit [Shewanella avicenniae]QSX32251.1 HlyD family efflux transporter periplasmic adaptor subunit [Shewanella avicenniae]
MMRRLLALVLLQALTACEQSTSVAMGTLERDRMLLTAPVNAKIVQLPVEEGQHVKQGEILVQLDTVTAAALRAQRQAELEQATAQLRLFEKGARQESIAAAQSAYIAAKAAAVDAERQYQRSQQLVKQQMVGQADVDNALANRDQTAAYQQQLYQQWQQLLNGNRPEEIEQAKQQVNAAAAALQVAEKSLADLSITAPKEGVVDILPWKTGDRVPAGAQLAVLLASERLYARVYVPQTALTKLHQGDAVMVKVDGLADSVQGVIGHIRSQPSFTPFYALNERDRARLMYLTEIEFPPQLPLAVGAAVEVRLP